MFVNEIDFSFPSNKKGKKPKLFLVLDCETATLPFVREMELTEAQRKNIAIARPLVYDLAWQIIDKKGNVYSRHSFIIQETFFVPAVFNTAYYREKRPLYIKALQEGRIITKCWNDAVSILQEDLQKVVAVTAYNAMFDYKKALNFTDEYIYHLYNDYDFAAWEMCQKRICRSIANKEKWKNPHEFDSINFNFRGKDYSMIDIWGETCRKMLANEKYKKECLKNNWLTNSGLFFKTSAEKAFAYLMEDTNFKEAHTALEDTIIESELLVKFFKRFKEKIGLTYFPFREVGNVYDYLSESAREVIIHRERKEREGKKSYKKMPVTAQEYNNAIAQMNARIEAIEDVSTFAINLANKVFSLESLAMQVYKDYTKVSNSELSKAIILYAFFDKKSKHEKDEQKMMTYNYCADMMFDLVDSYKNKNKGE